MKYAVRVKAVDYYHVSGYPRHVRARATPEVWHALQEFRPMTEFLPNLERLRWSWTLNFSDEQEGPGPLAVLASSKLQEVDMLYTSLNVDGKYLPLPASIADACIHFLSRLSRNTQKLKTLKINFLGRAPPVSSHISSLVVEAHNLTTFVSSDVPLPPLGFLHLAHCPSLQRFAAQIEPEDWTEELETILRRRRWTCFPALRDLRLQISDVELCIDMINLVSSREVQNLSLYLFGGTSVADVARFLSVLPTQLFALQLRKLDLTMSLASSPSPTMYAQDLAPLYDLDLYNLSIYGCEIAVSNELVRQMSEAWPNIVTLSLWNSKYINSSYKATLPGLLPFVYNCPHLKELRLEIDATNAAFPYPLPDIRPAFGSEQRALRELDPCYGFVSDPVFVAGFIADCFPKCERVISSWGARDLEYPDLATQRIQGAMWDMVWRLVEPLAKVRAQERHGAVAAGMQVRGPANPDVALRCVEALHSNPMEAARIALAHGLW